MGCLWGWQQSGGEGNSDVRGVGALVGGGGGGGQRLGEGGGGGVFNLYEPLFTP